MTRHHWPRITLALAMLASAACSSPTAPTETVESPEGTFSSILLPGTAAARAFTVSVPGTVSLTLSTTTPEGVIVGLGVGIPRSNGAGCTLNTTVNVSAGAAAQLSVAADSGTYCAQIFDVGTLAAPLPFTLLISRP